MQAVSRISLLWVAFFIVCLCVLQYFVAALEFDRQNILTGQVWRLWTGHFVHSHLLHLALNAVAAGALYLILFVRLKRLEFFCCGLIFTFLISLILLFLYPRLDWYNGLSGLLHALVSYACVRLAVTRSKLYWLGLLVVWLKVLIELVQTQAGFEYQQMGMTVITYAHFIGVWVGCISACCYLASRRVITQRTEVGL